MKKRFWSLLLVLVMVITMIPTTVFEAATPQMGYYYAKVDESNGDIVPDKTYENGRLWEHVIGCPGTSVQVFAYFYDEEGVEHSLTADDFEIQTPNVVKVTDIPQTPGLIEIKIVGFGSTTLAYYVDGYAYTIQIMSELPTFGCYSQPNVEEDVHLAKYGITEENNTFYVMLNEDDVPGYEISEIFFDTNLTEIATYEIDNSGRFAKIILDEIPEQDNYRIVCAGELPESSGFSGTFQYDTTIELYDGTPRFMCSYPEYDENNCLEYNKETYWQDSLRLWPARTDDMFFSFVIAGVGSDLLTNIVSSDEDVVTVSVNQTTKLVSVEGISVGDAELIYTDGNNEYKIPVAVTLPDVAFYTSDQPDADTLLTSGFELTDEKNEFYLISTIGNFESVVLEPDFDAIADVRYSGNVATITVTDEPDPNRKSYRVDYKVVDCDLNNQFISVNVPGQGDSGQGSGPAIPEGPVLGYCQPQNMNGSMTKPSSENTWWNHILTSNIGTSMPVYFSVVEYSETTSKMEERKAVAVDIVSSNPNVLSVEKLIDNNNVVYYRLAANSIGESVLTCTVDGVNYSITAYVQLPPSGFYTSTEVNPGTYTGGMIDVTTLPKTVYYVSTRGAFTSFDLSDDFKAIADFTWTEGSSVAQITIKEMPTGGNYQVVCANPNLGPGVMYDGVRFMANGQMVPGGPGNGGEPDFESPAPNSLVFHYEDDDRSTWGDCVNSAPGGQSEGWFVFYPEDGEPWTVPVDMLKVTNKDVVRITSVGTEDDPDKVKYEVLDWGTSKIVFEDPDGNSFAFDVIADIDDINVGFYSQNKIDEETYIPRMYELTKDNQEIYMLVQNVSISDVEFYYGSDDFARIDKISSSVYKVTFTEEIHKYAEYGEMISLNILYNVQGQGVIHDGIDVVNKICHHSILYLEGHKEAACTSNGYTGDEMCKQCGKVTKKGSVIPAVGHYYDGNKCVDCGEKAVVVEQVEKVDTTKPVDSVTPVVEQEVADTAAKEVSTIVDAILADKVTDEVKEAVSEETIEEIKKEIAAGKEITTAVVAKPIEEKDVDKEVVKEIEKELGTTGKVAQFLDLSIMIKSVAADGEEKDLGTLNVLGEKVKFTIVVPEDLVKEGREFYIVRVHDGEAEILDLTKNADGTYSFETDRFSTYALAYEEVEEAVKEVVAPKTGDDNNALGYLMLFAVAFAAFALAKKETYLVK